MPIYEYRCEDCGHEFEVIQRFSDEPISVCEGCGKEKAKRLISQTSFVLKGSGWYATDYGRKGANKEKETRSESSSPPAPCAASGSCDAGSCPKAAGA